MARAVTVSLRALVRAYQIALSPVLGSACRFSPTCSHYAVEALDRHGAARGSWLALRRVVRCHPFADGGYDPVPTGPLGRAGGARGSYRLPTGLQALKESDG
jgi:putative membrane protein insertion efficiency factor